MPSKCIKLLLICTSNGCSLTGFWMTIYPIDVVYRSCEGEDHLLVSDILRDDRRARGFHLGIRYKPNTPNIRSDSLKLLRKLKRILLLYSQNFKVVNMVEIQVTLS